MTPENIKNGNWDIFNEKCKNGKIYVIKNKLDMDFLTKNDDNLYFTT
jgi:hypothetical protein